MAGMVQTDLALIEAKSMLDVKREAYKARKEKRQQPGQHVDEQQLARIQEIFKKDSEVLALKREIDDIRQDLERSKRSFLHMDPARRVAAPCIGSISCNKSIMTSGS